MISIIVPAYNVEQYLSDCLDSVAAQTYQDYELLLVDDGSTDDTVAIADRFAASDQRFQVFRCAHSHAWRARNFGIDRARGEYLCFVDADDMLHSRALETLLEAARRHDATTVMAGYYESWPDSPHVYSPRPLRAEPERVMGPRTAWRAFVRGKLRDTVWSSLYHRDVFSTVRFQNRPAHEDAFFVPQQLIHSPKTVAIAPCLYYYRRRTGSITQTLAADRINSPAARLFVYDLCCRTYASPRLRAVAADGAVTSAAILAAKVSEQGSDLGRWRRRIHSVLPRRRLLSFCCNPLISLRARVLGGSLLLGLRPNAWVSYRLRSVSRLLRRMRTQ